MQNQAVNQTELQENIGLKLIAIIRMILITEREVKQVLNQAEELKITLAENIRFDISDAFRAIDSNMKGYIVAQDIFRFLSKNGYSVVLKFCDFWIYECTKGSDKLLYQNFLEFIVPRYDRDAAMQCITRKLYSEVGQYKLSFYLEEFVAKLIFLELEYLKHIEVEKMNLAQLVEWKFTTVFKYVAGNLPFVDKKCLDHLLHKFEIQQLTQQDYQMFLKRFNRNDDNVLQRDEFSDAIFPSGELIKEKNINKDGFTEYINNQNQELDQYLGKQQIKDEEDFIFKPEEHKIQTDQQEDLIKDKNTRKYLQEDPQLSQSHFAPVQFRNMSFNPTQIPNQQQLSTYNQQHPITATIAQSNQKSKKYQSPFDQGKMQQQQQQQQQQHDLLQQFERKPNQSQMAFFENNSANLQQNSYLEQSQQVKYNEYIQQPTNAKLLLSLK